MHFLKRGLKLSSCNFSWELDGILELEAQSMAAGSKYTNHSFDCYIVADSWSCLIYNALIFET
jgi:hypothetical protein